MALDSHTDQEDIETALSVLDEFADAWAPESIAEDPGEVTAVRYRLGGRYRRVFGRPRRFAAPPSNLILSGYVPITHDFETVDAYTYDDVESSAEILYSSSAEGGGFILPATLPIMMASAEGNGEAQVTVGGQARTYPIIRFNGPWTNPVMVTDDWTLRWSGVDRGHRMDRDRHPPVEADRAEPGRRIEPSRGSAGRRGLRTCGSPRSPSRRSSSRASPPAGRIRHYPVAEQPGSPCDEAGILSP